MSQPSGAAIPEPLTEAESAYRDVLHAAAQVFLALNNGRTPLLGDIVALGPVLGPIPQEQTAEEWRITQQRLLQLLHVLNGAYRAGEKDGTVRTAAQAVDVLAAAEALRGCP